MKITSIYDKQKYGFNFDLKFDLLYYKLQIIKLSSIELEYRTSI